MASASRRASLIAAASVGVVEALKDQVGLCRWNYPLRRLYQQAKTNLNLNLGSLSQSPRWMKTAATEEARRSEESLRTVMYLSSWAPN